MISRSVAQFSNLFRSLKAHPGLVRRFEKLRPKQQPRKISRKWQLCPLRPNMPSSLSARFAKIQLEEKETPSDELERFQKMSLEEMSQEVITFGKAHQGKTFAHMWENEKAWVKFMIATYVQSPKVEHQKFMIYADLMIERKELEQESNKGTTQMSRSLGNPVKARAKAKGYPSSSTKNPPLENLSWDDSESHWELADPQEETALEIQVLQSRMLHMENAFERGREFHPCSAEPSRRAELRTDSAVGHVFAGDSEAECWTKNQLPETLKECQHSLKNQFFQWVQDLTKELEVVEQSLSESSCRPIHLLEVFCSEQSELTKQALNLGYRARRFGFEQGDLSTPEGRRSLFEIFVNYKPKHVWYSPTCGPWCPWSWLNESMSLEACLKMQQKREDHLYQLALGIVILRKAKEIGSHFHWEQPQRGLMFKCPFLAELHENTYCASFDMCNVGQLKDPVSHLPIRKGTDLCATSWNVYQALNGRTCRQDHAHQEISGTTRCELGTIARSKFTERYTRKFARFMAKTMLKIKTIKERAKPNGFVETCAIFAEPSGRASKKSRVSSPNRQSRRRASEATVDTEPKRRRIEGKSPPENTIENVSEGIQKAVESCISLAPRVGKKDITSKEILEMFQKVFVDKQLVKIMAYKGTDRAQAPPRELFKSEAPFRRNIYLRRSDGKIVMGPRWESWSHLSKRQLCRHAIPARVCITLYASNPVSNSENAAQPQVPIENSKPPEQSWSRPETVEVQTPGMKADLESNKHGPRFLQLSREERSLLIRMHKNLGHPSPSQMYQVLKQNQASPRIVQGCLDLQCSICQSTKKPRIARPSSLKDELDFNDRIGVDGMEFTNSKGKVFHCYHVLDYGTSFHVACAAPNRSAEEVIENMSTCWFNWAGPPREIFTDAATEFTSEKFSDFLMKNHVRPVTIAPEAHWQLGKVERHGQTLQNMLKKYDLEHPIEDYHEFRQALNLCCSSKNALSLRKGFSPDILVFGKAVRLPGSIVSDEQLPSHLTADEDSARGISFRQQLARRETARRAFHECDNDMAMRRSILRRSRPTRESYSPGEWVMRWKKTGNLSSWIGPARVVQHYDQNNMWCEHLGRVFKTTPETTRPVTALEAQTIPPWNWPRDENQVRQESQADDYSLELPSENPHNQEQTQEAPSETDNRRHSHQSTEQPDLEPETQQSIHSEEQIDPAEIPLPPTDEEDELVCVISSCA